MATFKREIKKLPSEKNLRLLSSLVISLANKTSSVEDKCITPWKAEETYQKDVSFVVYNGYIYSCTVTNKDSVFTESHWTKLADNFDELSVDDVKAFLNLTPEQISKLSDIISTEIRLDKTFSSSDTYMRIQAAIDTAKEYTNNQLGKAVKPAYKVVSSTSEVTETGYFYLISNGTNFDMYVLSSDGSVVSLGTSEVDLSNYYTKTETDSDFLKKTDATSTYATITTVDGKVNKTDMVDNLTSTDTNKPLSANQGKILNDKKLDKADVGKITVLNANGVDIKDFILEKCTEKFKEYHIISTPTCTDIPANNYFYMIVRRTGNNTFKVTAKEANSTNEYVRNYRSDAAIWTKWAKVCTTTVEDIPKTNIAPANETTFVNFKGNSMCNYCVENGVCYVSLWGVQVTVTGRANTGVMLPLPKSGFFGGGELIGGGDAETHAYAHTIPETGELKFNVKDANIALYGSFSYPVAE